MTSKQVSWCSLHDWFIDSYYNVKTSSHVVIVKDDLSKGLELEFTDFNELRNWAGY